MKMMNISKLLIKKLLKRKLILKFAHGVLGLYWGVFHPKTFGVKILIHHPTDNEKILLVKHSYLKDMWNIPGGGYNPKKESAYQAAKREIKEELGVNVSNLKMVYEYYTELQGKKDTVIIFSAKLSEKEILRLDSEISEAKWFYYKEVLNMKNVAKVVKIAINSVFKTI